MPTQKNITIRFSPDADHLLVHQIRNFGEDIWRLIELELLGDLGGIETVDRATNLVKIRVFHTRKIGTVRKIVTDTLRTHMLHDRSNVEYH